MLHFAIQKRPLVGEQPRKKVILVVAPDAKVSAFLIDTITQRTPYLAFAAKDLFWALEIVRVITPAMFLFDVLALENDHISLSDHAQSQQELESIPALIFRTTPLQQQDSNQARPTLLLPFELDTLLQTIDKALAQIPSQTS